MAISSEEQSAEISGTPYRSPASQDRMEQLLAERDRLQTERDNLQVERDALYYGLARTSEPKVTIRKEHAVRWSLIVDGMDLKILDVKTNTVLAQTWHKESREALEELLEAANRGQK